MKKLLSIHSLFVVILISLSINAETGSLEIKLPVTSQESLIRLGSGPDIISDTQRILAKSLWTALKNNDMESVKKAVKLYQELKEDPYNSGLKWLVECIVASEKERKNLISGPLAEDFYKYWTDNNYAHLKDYLLYESKLNDSGFDGISIEEFIKQGGYLIDFLMYNNPR
ncbi:MAG: hypothetical protein AB1633_08645, partial [Elusimicrobiota bacterium]